MVDNQNSKLDLIFHAMSDATRRSILAQLAKGESRVTDLAKPHDQSLASISKHLKVLVSADLVKKAKSGREISCAANLEPLSEIYKVLEELGAYWRGRLDALEVYLDNLKLNTKEKHENTDRKRNTSKGYSKKNS